MALGGSAGEGPSCMAGREGASGAASTDARTDFSPDFGFFFLRTARNGPEADAEGHFAEVCFFLVARALARGRSGLARGSTRDFGRRIIMGRPILSTDATRAVSSSCLSCFVTLPCFGV